MNLNQKVLVINRNWQGVNEMPLQEALCDMYSGSATAIDTETMSPVKWDDWVKLPIRANDQAIRSLHGAVRVPTVIAKVQYAKMPKRRPKMSRRNVGKRDGHICQVSGEFCPDGTVDHVVSRARGGKTEWNNVAWMKRELNHRKGDKTLEEMGWKLRRQPRDPGEVPAVLFIKPQHPDWEPFLAKGRG